jgi:hypothetical protein
MSLGFEPQAESYLSKVQSNELRLNVTDLSSELKFGLKAKTRFNGLKC